MLESWDEFPATARPWVGLMQQSYRNVRLLKHVYPVTEGMLFVMGVGKEPTGRIFSVHLCNDWGDVVTVAEGYATPKGAYERALREVRDWNRRRYEELMEE